MTARRSSAVKWPKKIIHIDMDAFFASIEQRDRPELRGKPVVVGGDPEGRGVVSTCSYEARGFGIRSAMPAAEARRLCPRAVFLRPDFERYQRVSSQIMAILRQHTRLVEPVSLDEAYLDVTRHRFGIEDPVTVALLIKQNIQAVTRLTASAGVAAALFLAKMASDHKKPDGLTVIRPGEEEDFLHGLSVRKIPGVGPVTEKALLGMGIETVGQLAGVERSRLTSRFGKQGACLFERAHGIDASEVVADVEAKQYSLEETFERDVLDTDFLRMKIRKYAGCLLEDLRREGRSGRTIVLKVKYHDFRQITRSATLPAPPADPDEICRIAFDLLERKTEAGKKPVRLIGLGISGLNRTQENSDDRQKELFSGSDY